MSESIRLEAVGQRVYFRSAPFGAKDRIKAIGGHWDGDERCWWIGRAKQAEAERLAAALAAAPAAAPKAEDLDGRRVYCSVTYGERDRRRWYVIAESHAQGRCLICDLQGKGPKGQGPEWVEMARCNLVKTYAPRERTWRGHTTTEYTTLGSLRRFVEGQRALEAVGAPVCAGCGRRAHEADLVEDLEDCLLKHPRCCDIPPGGC